MAGPVQSRHRGDHGREKELWWNVPTDWVQENADIIEFLDIEVVAPAEPDSDHVEVRWTEEQARAFMLLDFLVHELGHHHDRMTTRGNHAPRGEPYANDYARRVHREVWPAYAGRFGL